MMGTIHEVTNHPPYLGSVGRTPLWLMLVACLRLGTVRAADELIQRQHDEPVGSVLLDGRLSADNPADTNPDDDYYFRADANEPIRITLCWTDPPGVYITDFDNSSPRLIHDLDLRVISPDRRTTYYPYILNPTDPCAIAATGDNKVDNVEQVYIGTPSQGGLYKIHISYKGLLPKDQQYYSIISNAPLFTQSPPMAEDASVYTSVNTALMITLKATDAAGRFRQRRGLHTQCGLPRG